MLSSKQYILITNESYTTLNLYCTVVYDSIPNYTYWFDNTTGIHNTKIVNITAYILPACYKMTNIL